MKYRPLGRTGLLVSELCYRALPIGPAPLSIESAADLIRYSLEQGINFIDTAQHYQTYEPILQALAGYPHPVVIASKSAAATYEEMRLAVEEARKSLKRDKIDIFHLHAAKAGINVLQERRGALEYLCDAKAKGLIEAIGVSTHAVPVLREAADYPEIDIVFPLVNLLGLGIIEGTLADMLEAIDYAIAADKGVYLMNVLAGGQLADRVEEAFTFARTIRGISSLAVGMMNQAEVAANVAYITGKV